MNLKEIETCGKLTGEIHNGMIMETNTNDNTIIFRFPKWMSENEKQIFENIREYARKEMKK